MCRLESFMRSHLQVVVTPRSPIKPLTSKVSPYHPLPDRPLPGKSSPDMSSPARPLADQSSPDMLSSDQPLCENTPEKLETEANESEESEIATFSEMIQDYERKNNAGRKTYNRREHFDATPPTSYQSLTLNSMLKRPIA